MVRSSRGQRKNYLSVLSNFLSSHLQRQLLYINIAKLTPFIWISRRPSTKPSMVLAENRWLGSQLFFKTEPNIQLLMVPIPPLPWLLPVSRRVLSWGQPSSCSSFTTFQVQQVHSYAPFPMTLSSKKLLILMRINASGRPIQPV